MHLRNQFDISYHQYSGKYISEDDIPHSKRFLYLK